MVSWCEEPQSLAFCQRDNQLPGVGVFFFWSEKKKNFFLRTGMRPHRFPRCGPLPKLCDASHPRCPKVLIGSQGDSNRLRWCGSWPPTMLGSVTLFDFNKYMLKAFPFDHLHPTFHSLVLTESLPLYQSRLRSSNSLLESAVINHQNLRPLLLLLHNTNGLVSWLLPFLRPSDITIRPRSVLFPIMSFGRSRTCLQFRFIISSDRTYSIVAELQHQHRCGLLSICSLCLPRYDWTSIRFASFISTIEDSTIFYSSTNALLKLVVCQ